MLNVAAQEVSDAYVLEELNRFIRQEHQAQKVMAEIRQRQAAADLGQNRRSLDGLGRPRLEVDTWAYNYWGQRLGYQCWRDEQFLREFERDNPHCRVKAKGTKDIMVGYSGLAGRSSGRKFTKSYG